MLDQPHAPCQLFVKTFKMLYQLLHSENSIVVTVGKMALSCATSPIGSNMAYLRHRFNINLIASLSRSVKRVYDGVQISSENQHVIDHIKSLFNCLQGTSSIDNFDNEMINIMLENLCTE